MATKSPAELKQIVADYCVTKGWEPNDLNMQEVLLYNDAVFTEHRDSHRWWNDEFRVVKVGDTLIGCMGATTTGDRSPEEVGWSFEWDSLCEVEAKEVTTTVYIAKKD